MAPVTRCNVLKFIQRAFGLSMKGQYKNVIKTTWPITVLLTRSQVFLSLYTEELVKAAHTCITPL